MLPPPNHPNNNGVKLSDKDATKPQGSTPQDALSNFWEGAVVFTYTRADALEDEILVDVSQMAREAGFKIPVALTATLWADISTIPDGSGQDEQGRLWDVLTMGVFAMSRAIQAGETGNTLFYELVLTQEGDAPDDLYQVKCVIGPGDSREPVVTLMRPGED
jgi:hypothetical protein